jgi:hypothetical protein
MVYLQGSNAVTVARSTETHTSSNFLITNFDDPGTGNLDYERRVCDGENQSLGMTGLNIVNQRTMAGNNTSVPMYSRYKFLSNSVLSRNNGKWDDESNSDSIAITMLYPTNADLSSDHAHLDIYASAGTDFNLIFFLNVPVLYHYDSLPVVP